MVPRRFGRSCVALVTCFALDASGETAIEPVRIEYQGTAGCPGERQVIHDILGRTARARRARPGEAARLFRLSTRFVEGRSIGRLEIVAQDGASTVREVRGKSCGEVIDALTLIARIATDPEQDLTSDASASPQPAAAQPPAPARERSPTRPDASKTRSDQIASQPRATRSTTGRADQPGTSMPFQPAIGAQAIVSTLISPGVAPGANIFAEVVGHPPSWLCVRAGLRAALSTETETSAGTARFSMVAARVGACLPRLPLSIRWTLCPFAGAEAGVVNARGFDTLGPRTATRPWLAAGVGLRVEWSITSRLFAELEVEGSAPVIRDRFVFDEPPTTVHETPAIGANVGVGLGYRFW